MEKLLVEVPPESLCIKSAFCPNGHDLMDPEHPMDGFPSIRAIIAAGGHSGQVNLHPRYGNFELHSTLELKEGEVYDLHCPHCQTSLRQEEEQCVFCGAPMFALRLSKGGLVQACTRKGCHNHKLKLVDVNAQLAGLFDLDLRPRY
jgi:hypothetical protein